MSDEVRIAIYGGVFFLFNGLFTVGLGYFVNRNRVASEASKSRAEASELIANASIDLIEPLRQGLDREKAITAQLKEEAKILETELEELRQEVQHVRVSHSVLLNGARRLHLQVKSMSGVPVYDPPETNKSKK